MSVYIQSQSIHDTICKIKISSENLNFIKSMIKKIICIIDFKDIMASIFVTHGAGPFPILAQEQHAVMYQQLEQIHKRYPHPKAIIIFSAHWQQKEWTILDNDKPALLFDYYGFPAESYKLTYPATSTTQLREQVKQQLSKKGIQLKTNSKRGYDHGVFIPLKIAYPKADIPVIQISILQSLNPQAHFRMGQALRDLKKQGFLILGSGSSVHGGFSQNQSKQKSKIFDEELADLCIKTNSEEELIDRIKCWNNLKYSKFCHPRQEHLVPLFINLGASQLNSKQQMKLSLYNMHFSNYIFS